MILDHPRSRMWSSCLQTDAQSLSLARRRRGTRFCRRRAAIVAALKIPRPTAPPTALANSRFAFCAFGKTSSRIPGWRALHLSRTGASRGVARSSPGGRGTVTTSSAPRIALPSTRRRKSSRSSTSSGSTLMRTSTACSAGAPMCLPPISARAARTATLAFARTRPVVIVRRLSFARFEGASQDDPQQNERWERVFRFASASLVGELDPSIGFTVAGLRFCAEAGPAVDPVFAAMTECVDAAPVRPS
jgi:hypothetical protein